MRTTLTGKVDFLNYLSLTKKTKPFYVKAYYKPTDISIADYKKLSILELSFDNYNKLDVLHNKFTTELFLGDINLGGHGAKCRIVKIKLADLLEKPKSILDWYANYAEKIWL